MAMNPMQRKVRNSFLFGFVVALLIGAVVAGLLIMKNKQAQEKIVEIQNENKLAMEEVCVVETDIKAGEPITVTTVLLPTQSVPANALRMENLAEYAEEDEDGNTVYAMLAKIDMVKNTVLTPEIIEQSKEAATYRTVEFNMISLPSMLEEGNFIDIRLACLGMDTVVLSKVKVEAANATTIWLKLSESQLLTLNYAIVESYVMEATKLYATVYTDELQPALNCTYIPDNNVVALVEANVSKNGKEMQDFDERYTTTAETFRDNIIQALKANDDGSSDEVEKITEGYQTEVTNIQAAREALMGDLGY